MKDHWCYAPTSQKDSHTHLPLRDILRTHKRLLHVTRSGGCEHLTWAYVWISLFQSVYSNDLSTPSKVGLYWREIGQGGERFIPTSTHYSSWGISCTTHILNSFFWMLPCWLHFEHDSLKWPKKALAWLDGTGCLCDSHKQAAGSWLTHMSGGFPVSPRRLAIMGNS